MIQKITYYLFMSIGIFMIVASIGMYFVYDDLPIKTSFLLGFSGLIPIFIALINKPPLK